MSILSEEGRKTLTSFSDWVSANSPDIPAEVVYPPKADDHGHGHDDHGHDAHCDAPEEHEDLHSSAYEALHADDAPLPAPKPARTKAVSLETSADDGPMTERKFVGILGWSYRLIAAICGVLLAIILLVTVAALPRFGGDDNPALNEVSRRYLEEGLSDTGAVNAVAGMILDYRAFDTLGESIVLFTATVTVIFLLQHSKRRKDDEMSAEEADTHEGVHSLPAKVVIGVALPFALLYGIYVVVNGHLSPGGGFSGGTILGGALILAHLAFGEKYTKQFVTIEGCTKVLSAALLVYVALKSYSVFTGANALESAIPLGTPGSIFSAGLIFPLNICVGLIVACTMFTLYSLFTKWNA